MFCDLFSFILHRSTPEIREELPELARLDVISIVLTVLTIFLAITALIGYGVVRAQTQTIAKDEAIKQAAMETRRFLEENSTELIKAHLKDAQVVARLHAQFEKLGLDDADEADDIDDDPNWTDDENGGS